MPETKLDDADSNPRWVEGELRLAGMLDARLIRLFAAIARTGSLNQAAKEVGLSYKGAWQIVERANNLAPKMLVTTATGGAKGGGTILTPAGQALLDLFTTLEARHRLFLQAINRELANDPDVSLLLRRLLVQASARNQIYGIVTGVRSDGLEIEVTVELKGGETLVATMGRAANIMLSPGNQAVALIKAPNVMLVTDFEGYRLSARNQLAGAITRIQKGAVRTEAIMTLPSGDSIVSILSNDSCDRLQLHIGMPVTAVFDEYAVILGKLEN